MVRGLRTWFSSAAHPARCPRLDNRPRANSSHTAEDRGRPTADPSHHVGILELPKEVNSEVPNPLAIGVTLGGLLLDLVAPRPKPQAGKPFESSLLSLRADSRTPRRAEVGEYERPPIAGGYTSV